MSLNLPTDDVFLEEAPDLVATFYEKEKYKVVTRLLDIVRDYNEVLFDACMTDLLFIIVEKPCHKTLSFLEALHYGYGTAIYNSRNKNSETVLFPCVDALEKPYRKDMLAFFFKHMAPSQIAMKNDHSWTAFHQLLDRKVGAIDGFLLSQKLEAVRVFSTYDLSVLEKRFVSFAQPENLMSLYDLLHSDYFEISTENGEKMAISQLLEDTMQRLVREQQAVSGSV